MTNNEEVYYAKQYMNDYKSLVEDYKRDMGIIGRFFAKLFGTNMYHEIENDLYNKYGMEYSQALTILYESYNSDYVYNPFK